MIERRHVFHIGGYDPVAPENQLERLRKSLLKFQKTWNVSSQISAIVHSSNVSSSWKLQANGPNWTTHVTFELLRWDDLVLLDSQRSLLSRVYQSTLALIDFTLTGTLFRYFRASWKYAGFFVFPYFSITALAFGSFGIAYAIARLLRLTGSSAVIIGLFVCVPIFIASIHWLDPRRRISHALDDAIFSRQFLNGQRIQMEKRIDDFANIILKRVRTADVDEILIVGHSLGAAVAIASLARSLVQDPELAAHGTPVCVLTVGATIPKFSLHPRGEELRQAAKAVAARSEIQWVEYQARDDVISFYRFDPVTLTRVPRGNFEGRPKIRRVQIHSMMNASSFRRHRFNFMRLHYQFLMGNDQRAAYDYCMITSGPLKFDKITAPAGGVDHFEANGAVIK
jgi:pimeloyl-ACP methyl ester carboxylesterase